VTSTTAELCGYTQLPEPDLMFAGNKTHKHPLVGLITHGPYSLKLGTPSSLRFAILAPPSDVEEAPCTRSGAKIPRDA
jgi:hypothetical protein